MRKILPYFLDEGVEHDLKAYHGKTDHKRDPFKQGFLYPLKLQGGPFNKAVDFVSWRIYLLNESRSD